MKKHRNILLTCLVTGLTINMSAYDALNFKPDFVNVQYYILGEGLTHLCNENDAKAKDNGCICKNNHFESQMSIRMVIFLRFLQRTLNERIECCLISKEDS